MMNWVDLISSKRFGMEKYFSMAHDDRSEFERDYDRIIFSSAFRRMQNKTQVFPLPGNIFVHNRLTHSLEVACVGRSIGNKVGAELAKKYGNDKLLQISSIVSAACLAHDMGNPPFGHSGEKAIATFFSEGEGLQYENLFTRQQWCDFTCFEGNANAFRLLTHQFKGRREGGYALTYSTLASIVKYPYASEFAPAGKQKFGFFNSEVDSYAKIANDLKIIPSANGFARHPLVYLVEAADDICYQLMDIEDAYRMRLISYNETKDLLFNYLNEEKQKRALDIISYLGDKHEHVAYLRSTIVGLLVDAISKSFVANEVQILRGELKKSMLNHIEPALSKAYSECASFAFENIYKSSPVVDIEMAGYRIITDLLSVFTQAALSPEKAYSKQILNRVPEQYEVQHDDFYTRFQAVLDYVSGMTDVYALDLYRKITGMSLPAI